MFRTQYMLALLVLYVGLAHSWDLALSAGDELRFYTNNTITNTIRFKSQNLTALAYDEVHNMMLYVDKQPNNDTICGYYLSCKEIKCFTERNGRNIHGIAFDPATDTVFFTDTNERSVNWISLKPGYVNHPNGNILFKIYDAVPRDIVVDSCKGYIYWLNTNMVQPTIERARLNGYAREVFKNITSLPFNTTHNLEPHSLAFDQQTQAIYWIEPVNTTRYYLYVSQLNRKHQKTTVHYPRSPYPLFLHPSNTLTASKNVTFAVDFRSEKDAVFQFTIINGSGENFKINFYVHHDRNIPIGIVANYKIADQIQGLDCEALESRVMIAPECDGPFCVHGMNVNGQSVCKCTPGYTGERCAVSICENYCLQGNCSFSDEGLPECRCDAGYSGDRCEVYACHGYCLNDGDCSLNEEHEPVCQCVGSYEGTRCEGYTGGRSNVSVCEKYCLQGNCSYSDEGLPKCRCDAGYSGDRCEVYACHGYCLNDGDCSLNEEHEPVCQCVGSYEGTRCEGYTGGRSNVSVCENYCLQGNCSFNDKGLPECRCDAGYSGDRCEVYACHGYCLNDGDCSLNEEHEPFCQCVGSYEGTRCEGYTGGRSNVSACEDYCLQGNCSFNDKGLPECRCDAGYSGDRCEVYACHGYCLNDGDCSLNEEHEPVCQCVGSYAGTRCEADTNDTSFNTFKSSPTQGNLTLADVLWILQKPSSIIY